MKQLRTLSLMLAAFAAPALADAINAGRYGYGGAIRYTKVTESRSGTVVQLLSSFGGAISSVLSAFGGVAGAYVTISGLLAARAAKAAGAGKPKA